MKRVMWVGQLPVRWVRCMPLSVLGTQRICASNPFAGVQLKKAGRHLPRYFYEKELNKLFEVVMGDTSLLGIRNRLLLEILYGTGARVSEVAGLTLGMIDQQARIITITGKGNKTRIVPYGQYAADALAIYLADARPALLAKSDTLHDTLFVNQRGQALTTSGIEYIPKQLAKKRGWRRLCRRTCSGIRLPLIYWITGWLAYRATVARS